MTPGATQPAQKKFAEISSADIKAKNRQNFLRYGKIYPPEESLGTLDFNIFIFSNAVCKKRLSVAKPATVLTWHNNC